MVRSVHREEDQAPLDPLPRPYEHTLEAYFESVLNICEETEETPGNALTPIARRPYEIANGNVQLA